MNCDLTKPKLLCHVLTILLDSVLDCLVHHYNSSCIRYACCDSFLNTLQLAQFVHFLQEIDPSVQGVRLTNYSTFGRDAGHSGLSQEAEAQQAPGMLDRVKQLVGLGPSTDTVVTLSTI